MIELILTYKNNDKEENIKSTIQIISFLYCENVEDTIKYDDVNNQALVILENYSEWNFGTIHNELMRTRDFLINVEENVAEVEDEEETIDDVEVIEPTEKQTTYSFTLVSEEEMSIISLISVASVADYKIEVVRAWNNDLTNYYNNENLQEMKYKKYNTFIFYIKDCEDVDEAKSRFNYIRGRIYNINENIKVLRKHEEEKKKEIEDNKPLEILEFCNNQNDELSSVEYSSEIIYMENEDNDKPLEAENLLEFNALLNAKEKKEDSADLKPLDYEGDLFNNWSDEYQTAFYYPVFRSVFYNKR